MTPYLDRPALRRSLILTTVFAALLLAAVMWAAGPARAGVAGGATLSGGMITADSTWTGVLTITEPFTVTRGTTLTIEPGTEVRFNAGTWLYVEGGLNARGSQSQQIRMIGATDALWRGIIVTQPSNNVLLQSVTISNAEIGLAIQQRGVQLSAPTGRVDVLDSLFSTNITGVQADYSEAAGAPRVTLRNNLLTRNGTGLRVKVLPPPTAMLKLNHNSFVGNDIGLEVLDSGKGTLRARQQWWNSPNGPRPCISAPAPGAGDRVCGPADVAPWSKVPTGRMILAAGAGAVLESELGPMALNDDDVAPTSVVTLTVPTGTFGQQVDLLVSGRARADMPPPSQGLQPTQLFLEVTAMAGRQEVHRFAGTQRLHLTIHYLPQELGGVDPAKLVLYYWDEARQTWSFQGIGTRPDPANQRIDAWLEHLSRFGLMGANLSDVWLPLIMR